MPALTQRIVNGIKAPPEPVQAEGSNCGLLVKAQARFSPIPSSYVKIQGSPVVCGGEAGLCVTRIAVWMLEEARLTGVEYLELLKDYLNLSFFDLEAV
jgi:uncharacterized protein (DUF433 family)